MLGKIRKILLFFVGVTVPTEGLAIGGSLGPAFSANKIATIVLLFFSIGQVLKYGARFPKNIKNLFLVVFMVTTSLSAAYSVAWGASVLQVLSTYITAVALFLFYFLLIYVVRDRGDIGSFLNGMVIGGGLVATTSLLQIGGKVMESSEGVRSSGVGANVNESSTALLVILVITIGYQFYLRSKPLRIVVLVCAFLCFLGILHSLSREAWVGLVAVGGVAVVRYAKTGYIRHVLIGFVLIASALPFLVSQDMVNRAATMEGGVHSKHATIQGRLHQYRRAIIQFSRTPLFGVGLLRSGMFKSEGGVLERSEKRLEIHNAYLQVLTEQGILGLTPFIAIWILSWIDCSRAWVLRKRWRGKKDRLLQEYGGLSRAVQLAILGCAVANAFSPAARTKVPYVLFALSTILLSLCRKQVELYEYAATIQEPSLERIN